MASAGASDDHIIDRAGAATKRVVLISSVWPEPRSSAAGLRDQNFIETFQKLPSWELFLLSAATNLEAREYWTTQGVQTCQVQLNDSGFDELVAELRPDYVIFDRFITEEQFSWRVQKFAPEAVRILDTQDLHFVRRARQKAHQKKFSLEEITDLRPERRLWREILTDKNTGQFDSSLKREVAAILRNHLSLILSTEEHRLLVEQIGLPPEKLMILPFGYQIQTDRFVPNFEQRQHLCMIGNFRHPPNHDAAIWMSKEIWPKLRKELPAGTELHLYGAYPPKEISQLDDPQSKGVRVKGWTENAIKTLSEYRISLAPLRFGAGIKGKVTDSWQAGTPVVTTPIGAEGMWPNNQKQPEGFPAKIVMDVDAIIYTCKTLYEDQSQWEQLQNSGRQYLANNFDWKHWEAQFLSRLQSTSLTSDSPFSELLTQILWDNSFAKNQYFSRWIELKNQLKSGTEYDSLSKAPI